MSIQATKIINAADSAVQSLVDGVNVATEWYGYYAKQNKRFDSVACARLIVDSIANGLEEWVNAGEGENENFENLTDCLNAYIEGNLSSWNLKEFKALKTVTLAYSMERLHRFAQTLILRLACSREHLDSKGAAIIEEYAAEHNTSVVSLEAVTAYTRVAVFANGHYCTMHDQTELDAISYSYYTFKNRFVCRTYSYTKEPASPRKLLDHELAVMYTTGEDSRAYFVYKGQRHYMDEYTYSQGSDLDGYQGICNTAAYGVKLLDGGEYVALYLCQ